MSSIIKNVLEKYRFKDTDVKVSTIKGRIRHGCNTLAYEHGGHVIPMKNGETHIVTLIEEISQMFQPITP